VNGPSALPNRTHVELVFTWNSRSSSSSSPSCPPSGTRQLPERAGERSLPSRRTFIRTCAYDSTCAGFERQRERERAVAGIHSTSSNDRVTSEYAALRSDRERTILSHGNARRRLEKFPYVAQACFPNSPHFYYVYRYPLAGPARRITMMGCMIQRGLDNGKYTAATCTATIPERRIPRSRARASRANITRPIKYAIGCRWPTRNYRSIFTVVVVRSSS